MFLKKIDSNEWKKASIDVATTIKGHWCAKGRSSMPAFERCWKNNVWKFKGFAVCRLPWKSIQNFDELKSAKPIQARPDTLFNIGLKRLLSRKVDGRILRVLWRLKALHFTRNWAWFYNIRSRKVLDSERVGSNSPNVWKRKVTNGPLKWIFREKFHLATTSAYPFSRPIWGPTGPHIF